MPYPLVFNIGIPPDSSYSNLDSGITDSSNTHLPSSSSLFPSVAPSTTTNYPSDSSTFLFPQLPNNHSTTPSPPLSDHSSSNPTFPAIPSGPPHTNSDSSSYPNPYTNNNFFPPHQQIQPLSAPAFPNNGGDHNHNHNYHPPPPPIPPLPPKEMSSTSSNPFISQQFNNNNNDHSNPSHSAFEYPEPSTVVATPSLTINNNNSYPNNPFGINNNNNNLNSQDSSLLSPLSTSYPPLAPVGSASSTKTATPSSPATSIHEREDNNNNIHTARPSLADDSNNLTACLDTTNSLLGNLSVSSPPPASSQQFQLRSDNINNNHFTQQPSISTDGYSAPPLPPKVISPSGVSSSPNNETSFGIPSGGIPPPLPPMNYPTNSSSSLTGSYNNPYLQRAPSAPESSGKRSNFLDLSSASSPRRPPIPGSNGGTTNPALPSQRLASSILGRASSVSVIPQSSLSYLSTNPSPSAGQSGTSPNLASPSSVNTSNSANSSNFNIQQQQQPQSPATTTTSDFLNSGASMSSLSRNSSVSSSDPSTNVTPWSTDQSAPPSDLSKDGVEDDWYNYWNIKIPPDQLNEFYNKYDIRFQSELYSFIQYEENYVRGLHVFLTVFKDDRFINTIPTHKERDLFVKSLFEPLQTIFEVNSQYLLAPFTKQQMEHKAAANPNPFVDFLYNDVLQWLNKIEEPFLLYAHRYTKAADIVSDLRAKNEAFNAYINDANTEAKRLCRRHFDSLMESTRNRFVQYNQHFSSLKSTLQKKMDEIEANKHKSNPDINLLDANDESDTIAGLEACILNCKDIMTKYNEIQRVEGNKHEMARLQRILKFKESKCWIPLNLLGDGTDVLPCHEKIAEKEVYRKKSSWESHTVTVLLLDNFLVLVKKQKHDEWQVLERPIHMDLLRIESAAEPSEYKNAILNVAQGSRPSTSRHNNPSTLQPLQTHKPSVSSISSMASIYTNENSPVSPIVSLKHSGTTGSNVSVSRSSSSTSRASSTMNVSTPSSESFPISPAMTPQSPQQQQQQHFRHHSVLGGGIGSGSNTDSNNNNNSNNPNMAIPMSSSSTATTTSSSVVTSVPPTPVSATIPKGPNSLAIDLSNKNNDKLIHPVKLRNLENNEKWRLGFDRTQDRDSFIDLLTKTKDAYNARRYEKNRVPLGVKVLDRSSFTTSDSEARQFVRIGSDPVERALQMYTSARSPSSASSALLRSAKLICALDLVHKGQRVTFVGTTIGIYGARHSSERSYSGRQLHWREFAKLSNVTHLEANIQNNVLFVLANNQLLFMKLSELFTVLSGGNAGSGATSLAITPPQLIQDGVECFRTGVLGDHHFLFFAKRGSKALEKTDVTVYEIAPKQATERHSKGFRGLLRGNRSSNKPYNEFLQLPTLIDHELFAPTQVFDFTFFESYFFFHLGTTFHFLTLDVRQPVELPRTATMVNILEGAGYSQQAAENIKNDISAVRPVAVARMYSSSHNQKLAPSARPNLIHCFHKFAVMTVRNGDLFVPPAPPTTSTTSVGNKYNGNSIRNPTTPTIPSMPTTPSTPSTPSFGMSSSDNRRPFKFKYLQKIERAYFWYPYLLLFSSQMIEVRLVTAQDFNRSLVQVITGRNIKLLTGRSSHPPHGSSSSSSSVVSSPTTPTHSRSAATARQNSVSSTLSYSSSISSNNNHHQHNSSSSSSSIKIEDLDESPRILISMDNPDTLSRTSLILELVRNSNVSPNDESLRNTLYDVSQPRPSSRA